MNDLEGKVALVTGGGSGIGRATAIALAEAGAAVVVADIDDGGGRETVRLLEEAGHRAAFVRTDVTRWEDIQRMVAFAEETFGGLDILHNNAGINAGWPRFPEAPRERWDRTIAVNLWAVIAGTEAAVPAMRRRGGGAIVNSASLAGLIAYQEDPIYAATKHGVVGLTRALKFLKDEANIRVNCVCPSFVDTPLPRRRLDSMPAEERARWEAILARIPMVPPSEVADAVLEFIRDGSLAGEAMAIQYGQPRRLVPAAMSLM
ncbi:MAG TPA: SDR family NAD(P)-dependent oxidoreductase [Dehalococcoidia bacterium]|nr:SDR family NAD(P)-dependent oxidoreductase [Dehalococcoidia bacterium]